MPQPITIIKCCISLILFLLFCIEPQPLTARIYNHLCALKVLTHLMALSMLIDRHSAGHFRGNWTTKDRRYQKPHFVCFSAKGKCISIKRFGWYISFKVIYHFNLPSSDIFLKGLSVIIEDPMQSGGKEERENTRCIVLLQQILALALFGGPYMTVLSLHK